MPDAHLAEQLTASRIRWIECDAGSQWNEWIARTAANAYRGRAPLFTSLRIHSLPGTLWEVLKDGSGAHCIVADEELTATLAELGLLSTLGATPDAGYDKSILMLADAFRALGDFRRYAACMGWAIPRTPAIKHLRCMARNRSGHSAETMIVLLHEIAHRVLSSADNTMQGWRDMSAVGVEKVRESLDHGGQFREWALTYGMRLGLPQAQAKQQIMTYLDHLRGNQELIEELTCDLLAVMAFLNLKSAADVLSEPYAGPTGMTTKQVGDALFVAHGAMQNIQLLTMVQAIAASVATGPESEAATLDRGGAELTARSTILVFQLSTLLQVWCEHGHLRDEWSARVPNAKGALLAAIERRNAIRTMTLLDPLQDLDGVLHEAERFVEFERQGLDQLRMASIVWPGRRKPLDAARWALTLARTST